MWDAGSSTVTNNDGSITSSVRANPSAGFSIVTYTGDGSTGTVGHGLGAAPEMIIIKDRDSNYNWYVYHKSIEITKVLFLDTTLAASSYSRWNSTYPTSSVFTVQNAGVNQDTKKHVAYCFAPVEGYSAFGSYTGNGLPDGPFVYTGFRPRWVMVKRTDTTGNWNIYDAGRDTYNLTYKRLYPNLPDEEGDGTLFSNMMDLVSNGFKMRGSNADTNGSGATYIYAAFAENPFALNARAR
jgi:hypothetical protein